MGHGQVMIELTGDEEIWHWQLKALNQVFNFNLSVNPLPVLTQHKARGRSDSDLFNLIDEGCKTGSFSLQSI